MSKITGCGINCLLFVTQNVDKGGNFHLAMDGGDTELEIKLSWPKLNCINPHFLSDNGGVILYMHTVCQKII